jgi:hypothetical protein
MIINPLHGLLIVLIIQEVFLFKTIYLKNKQ